MTDTAAAPPAAIADPPKPGWRARLAALATDPSDDAVARRTALFAFSVRVGSAAIAYLSQIVLARWMGTSEYGIYVFVWTWVLILGNLSGLGFGVAAARFVPEHRDRGEFDRLRGFTFLGRWTGVGLGGLVGLAGIGVVTLLGSRVESPFLWPLLLAMVCLPMFALSETQDGVARCWNAAGVGLVPPYILRPLLVLAAMAGAHHLGFEMTAATAMKAAIVATWVAALVQLVLLERLLRPHVPKGPRAYVPALWYGAGFAIFIAEGARVIGQNIDVVILAGFAPPADVGVYFAVTKTLVLGAFVAFAVGAAVAHRYAEYHAAGDKARLQAFVTRTSGWTFWPTLAAVLVMLALGQPFLALFGPEFTAGYPLMFILSAGLLVRAAVGPAERLLASLGEQRVYARIVVATLIGGVALHLVLVPTMGAKGSAVALALVAVLESLLLAAAAKSRLGLDVAVWHRPGPEAGPDPAAREAGQGKG